MTDYQITLTTRDGQAICFSSAADTDLVTAGEQAGIILPALCRNGGCGACLGHCRDGVYTLGEYSPSVLSAAAAAQGEILLCRTFAQSDLQINAPYDFGLVRFGRLEVRPAVITGLTQIAERTLQLKLQWQDMAAGQAVEFEPGQCMELEIPDSDVRRAYSLANTGNWRGELEFLIRLQPEGKFSGYLRDQAAIGQILNVYGPGGSFALQANRFNPALFIAGGTGLAPFLSMLRRLAEWGEDRSIHLLLGINQESELFYLDELLQLQQQLPGFSMTVCVWRPSATWRGFSGTPVDALQQYLQTNPADYDIYLCGPPLLVTAATQLAIDLGVAEQQIYSEKFV